MHSVEVALHCTDRLYRQAIRKFHKGIASDRLDSDMRTHEIILMS